MLFENKAICILDRLVSPPVFWYGECGTLLSWIFFANVWNQTRRIL